MARRQQPQSPDIEPVNEVVETVNETFASGAVPVGEDGEPLDLDDFEDDDDDDYVTTEPSPQPVANGDVARTSNFFDSQTPPVNTEGSMVVDRGIEVVAQEPESNIVRVTEDIGPIFLGRRRQLAMSKGVAYKVDPDILQYLRERNLVMGE